jgi:hypothetical protein
MKNKMVICSLNLWSAPVEMGEMKFKIKVKVNAWQRMSPIALGGESSAVVRTGEIPDSKSPAWAFFWQNESPGCTLKVGTIFHPVFTANMCRSGEMSWAFLVHAVS